jgi:hypothetical protein
MMASFLLLKVYTHWECQHRKISGDLAPRWLRARGLPRAGIEDRRETRCCKIRLRYTGRRTSEYRPRNGTALNDAMIPDRSTSTYGSVFGTASMVAATVERQPSSAPSMAASIPRRGTSGLRSTARKSVREASISCSAALSWGWVHV